MASPSIQPVGGRSPPGVNASLPPPDNSGYEARCFQNTPAGKHTPPITKTDFQLVFTGMFAKAEEFSLERLALRLRDDLMFTLLYATWMRPGAIVRQKR
jgi:hypothetical protein